MKKVIAILIAIICIATTAEADLYYRFGNVIDIEYDSDFVTVDDGMGNLWDFYGVEYMFYDDLVVMIMDDSGTADWIYDDKVVNAYKCDFETAEELVRNVRGK